MSIEFCHACGNYTKAKTIVFNSSVYIWRCDICKTQHRIDYEVKRTMINNKINFEKPKTKDIEFKDMTDGYYVAEKIDTKAIILISVCTGRHASIQFHRPRQITWGDNINSCILAETYKIIGRVKSLTFDNIELEK